MTVAAPAFEDYSIIRRSGDAVVSRLALTGWQTAAGTLKTWSDRGRMWGKVFADSGGDRLTLYRRPGLASGDGVCSGLISSSAVTMTALNSSGITGSCDVLSYTSGDESLFDIVVSYADEQDIVTMYHGAANELDTNSKYEGLLNRFESVLLEQKRVLDNLLYTRLRDQIGVDTLGRPQVGYIADPRQLARVHALLCVAQLYERRGNLEPAFDQGANDKRAQARSELKEMQILLDSNRDHRVDGEASAGVLVVRRA